MEEEESRDTTDTKQMTSVQIKELQVVDFLGEEALKRELSKFEERNEEIHRMERKRNYLN
jgi:hypothetical protein